MRPISGAVLPSHAVAHYRARRAARARPFLSEIAIGEKSLASSKEMIMQLALHPYVAAAAAWAALIRDGQVVGALRRNSKAASSSRLATPVLPIAR
jgi:hypothetical protein